MRATALLVKNVLGIEELRIEPGQVTRISGHNGTGKSSVLAALRAALGSGNLEHLRRVGSAEDPEVVLVLDDGAYRIEYKGEEKVVKQRVGDSAAYETIRRPQSWLDSLFDPYGCNPLTFLHARPQDRADIFLEVLPLQLDRQALLAKLGQAWPAGKELIEGHALQVLSHAHTVLFDERTGVNRSAKDKDSSAYEVSKHLPAELPKDPEAAHQAAVAERDDLYRKIAAKKADAEVAEREAVAKAQATFDQTKERVSGEFKTAAARMRTELEKKIAALKEETEAAIAAEREKGEAQLGEAEEVLDKVKGSQAEIRAEANAIADALQPDLQKLNERVADLAAQSKNAAQLHEQKRLADRFEREAAELKISSARLTEAIETVNATKLALLQDLPIAGLEIRGKEILVNGVTFEQLNHGQRIKIAVQVALLRAKKQVLPFVFVDGAESLDPEAQQMLEEELVAAGVQVVVARREPGELKIETREGGVRPASEAKVVNMPPPSAPKRRRTALAE